MVSQQRNVGAIAVLDVTAEDPPRAANAIPEQLILDAAYELLLAVGMRRMSMADIARKAGVSRATLYRRWPNVRAVVGALTTREFETLSSTAFAGDAETGRAGLVVGIVAAVRAVRVHPLTRKIIDVDPEFLLPYLLERRGTSTTAQLELIELALTSDDGSIRVGNRILLARTLWLTAWSFALTAPVLVDGAVSLDELDDQLRELLDRYLAP
ncbi:MAG: helix-turn-helix domain-containing protein [Jatrophihabitantaceae bacterium]